MLRSFLVLLVTGISALAQAPGASRIWPNLENNIDRPLRYRPEGADFVIENGEEFFNRPLYGGNTAFRADGGDKPEFVLYLPGRGGNLRFGLRSAAGTKWLHEAKQIVTRYRPGMMIYEVRDPLLGSGSLTLEVLALAATDGLVVRATPTDVPTGVELCWAFGGANGQKGKRDGDIGTESVPISQWFQLKPEFCKDNVFEIAGRTFTMKSKPATMLGLMPEGATLAVGDATKWNSAADLLGGVPSAAPTLPVMVGRVPLKSGTALYLGLQRIGAEGAKAEELDTYKEVTAERPGVVDKAPAQSSLLPPFAVTDLPRVFSEADAHFAKLRTQISVDTPDAFINAAVGALCVAADGDWDEPSGTMQHGAVAWRAKLLGWRGPYALDALGWHDRARRNFTYWAGRQNTDAIPEKLPPPDENANLSRSEKALHSNGDMSNSHYDMNLVHIDALFRHLLWTGDLAFAKQEWPVIERHLAWERRLFRREYGPAKLPLYEAYAAIWASDDLQYSGGGTAHASAYNYWHNKMAARVAALVGADGAPYEKEAQLIARAMRELLWLPDKGMFGEYKDLLGLQRVHPSAAVWSFYHTMDAELPTADEAYQMAGYVAREIPHLPVRGPGVPPDLFTVSTSNWMPYTWSLNNVTMNEANHTALALWQAGASEQAFRLMKGSLLASMYLGICPGNVGSMNYLDVYRRESQRDFADPNGVTSRAVVEGLFGVKPDALAGVLTVEPGFPAAWDHATLKHADVGLAFKRTAEGDHYAIEQRFTKPMAVKLLVPLRGARVLASVDGKSVEAHVRGRLLEVAGPMRAQSEIVVRWEGELPSVPTEDWAADHVRKAVEALPALARVPSGPGECVDLTGTFNDRVTQIFKHEYRSPRSPYVSLALPKQGIGAWAGHMNETADIDDTGLRAAAKDGRMTLPNGVPLAIPARSEDKNVAFVSQWDNFPRETTVPLTGKAHGVTLLMAGTTNPMQSRIDNGEVTVTYTDGSSARLALENPTTWWPIEQDYFIDAYQFQRPGPLPIRVDLKSGKVRVLNATEFTGKGGAISGGAATVLELGLDETKELKSLTVRALANDVIIGLMAATLAR